MSTPINFITPTKKVRLAKEVTADGVRPYPRVKALNSETHHLAAGNEGLAALHELLQKKAKSGAALIKGPLNDTIIDESRRGKVDSNAPTTLLVLDIDGWLPDAPLPTPITQNALRQTAEGIIGLMPEPLCSTSYIVNASSSTGVKATGEVGLHFFFLLERAVAPKRLEGYLKSLNFCHEQVTKQIGLQASRMSLKWAVDPVVARNAQIVYIANPTFTGTADPFATAEDRWALVTKAHGSCDITQSIALVNELDTAGAEEKALTELRKSAGLGKFKPKLRRFGSGDGAEHIITNPDPVAMEKCYESDSFVYWNLNGGDSNAYYNPIGNPEIIYNFKGEPPFEMKKASPETYDWYREAYKHQIRTVTEARPLVFRDEGGDQHYAATYIPAHDTVETLNKISRYNIDDWMRGCGMSTPDPIPSWTLTFDPQSTVELNWTAKTLNQFQATEYLKSPPAVMPQYSGATIGHATEAMAALCPTIHKVLFHICGSDLEDFEYFINWLAWCVQHRDKAHTAWVFSGVPGTGKGVFYERILRPIMGEDYAVRKRLDHLEEQFNSYQETALFLVWEEFRLGDSRQAAKLLNKIKDDVVSDRVDIRAMRTDLQQHRSYTNYIFFSNHTDAVPVEDGDRRFNIARPQLTKLEVQYPTFRREIHKIEDELGTFAGFLAAYQADEDLVRTVRETDAKQQMKQTAMGFGQRFCHAVKTGELAYFLDLTSEPSTSSTNRAIQAATVQKFVDAWARDATRGEPSRVSIGALMTCYAVINDSDMPQAQFNAFLKRNDITMNRQRVAGQRTMAVDVRWNLEDPEVKDYAGERAQGHTGTEHSTRTH